MTAIRTERLTKRYGHTLALDALDLLGRAGRGLRLSRAERRRQDHHHPAPARAARPTAGWAELFGVDAWRDPVPPTAARLRAGRALPLARAHRDGDARFLARLRGGIDAAYRDELIERFELDPDKRVRALSKGNRQKVQLDRGARQPRRPPATR